MGPPSASGRNARVAYGSDRKTVLLLIDTFVHCSDAVQSRLVAPIAMLANIRGSLQPRLLIMYKIFVL